VSGRSNARLRAGGAKLAGVAPLLRVFLIGLARDDLDRLRAQVRQDAALEIVGEALRVDVDEQRVPVPSSADAVIMSREATPGASIANAASSSARDPSRAAVEDLTPRERDVLALLSDGYGNRVIADRLGISEHTVKFHLASIFGKLGASTRTEAVRKGLDLGLIDI
jgi:DNA-binding NarL/FixJ family response regulator